MTSNSTARGLISLAIMSLAVWVSGCTSSGGASAQRNGPAFVPKPQTISDAAARSVPIVHADGSPATWQELVTAANAAEAVLVGENHGHPLGLAAASALWHDMLVDAHRGNLALALEFFDRGEQTRIDDYLFGITDEPTFLKLCARTSSNYPPGHRAMVEDARLQHRPVIAANVPQPYVHFSRLEGYEHLPKLSPAQRSLFRIPDVIPSSDTPYRKAFDDIMESQGKSHGNEPASPTTATPAERSMRFDNAFRAQTIWDWTMADSVAQSIDRGNHPTLLVVGRFHVDHHGGLPMALESIRPNTRTLIISFVDERAPQSPKESDRNRADYIIYVGPSN